MPWSLNGIGTGIVPASKKRTIDGHTQFDAIEAVLFLYLPLIPYSVIHVLSLEDTAVLGQQYQSFDLRDSPRITRKAFLNGWGNVLLFVGLIGLPIMGYSYAMMNRPMEQTDWALLVSFVVVLLLGGIAKLLWSAIDARDQRIRNIIGPHELGTSDPCDWTDATAFSARDGILQHNDTPSLLELAEKTLNEGDAGGAMLYVRLAMRCEPGPQADALFAQILAG
jgi:hypothetical protein